MPSRLLTATATAGLVAGGLLLGAPTASADSASHHEHSSSSSTAVLKAKLHQLNRSGAHGTARATVDGTTIDRMTIQARGLSPDGPHAVHIHYGEQAEHECPTMGDATERRNDRTRRLSTTDGIPYYGGIVTSLTTRGDTTPGSALALDRMPVAENGVLRYSRSAIDFTGVAGAGSAGEIAAAVRAGEGVVVVHGVDYDRDGAYSLGGAGVSDLGPVPAEATDPALCGVLEREHAH